MTNTMMNVRALSAVAALLSFGAANAAGLTLPTNALVAESVQLFSQEALDNFDIYKIVVKPLGNTSQSTTNTAAFSLPITSITIGSKLQISKGDAKGSALDIVRTFKTGRQANLVLANFTINYDGKQVLADATPKGGVTIPQLPLFNYNVGTALALKYKFPLSITGHEVLDTLKFTPEAVNAIMSSLELIASVRPIVEGQDNGTLTQDIAIKFRPKAVNATPYKPAP